MGQRTAERLNHDQFDILCRAADIDGAATLPELAEALDGVNCLQRAKVAIDRCLILESFIVRLPIGNLYQITEAGHAALK